MIDGDDPGGRDGDVGLDFGCPAPIPSSWRYSTARRLRWRPQIGLRWLGTTATVTETAAAAGARGDLGLGCSWTEKREGNGEEWIERSRAWGRHP